MKKIGWTALILLSVWLLGCASTDPYTVAAKEQSFADFFPSSDFYCDFSSIDEAYDFVRTASIKFANSIGDKRRVKGLAAKLIGPPIPADSPVTLVCYIRANSTNYSIDLSEIDKPLDTVLRQQAEDVMLIFLIFSTDRAISLTTFYLDPKWGGYTDGNAQIQEFGAFDNTYEADYPNGWGIEKAFQYLRDG